MSTYDAIGQGYGKTRREDPRIADAIWKQLHNCQSVLNVGAGLGSYEPRDRFVVAAEASATMIRQRALTAAPAIQADAHSLPFRNRCFDASLAVLTLHHWNNWQVGLRELARVASKVAVILTWYPTDEPFWLNRYFPELADVDGRRFPTATQIVEVLGAIDVIKVPIPHDCHDGFAGAYWRRPYAYLDDAIRAGMSIFHEIRNVESGVAQLRAALKNGSWQRDFGHLLSYSEIDLGYRLIICRIAREA